MILIVGASSSLGVRVAQRLLADGEKVRALTRTPASLTSLAQAGAEVVVGNLLDSASLARACQGVDSILYAAHGLLGRGAESPSTVDAQGMARLVDAARAADVRHVVMTSIQGARPDHPLDLYRAKAAGEQTLKASGLSATILRPTAYMERWLTNLTMPMPKKRQMMIFGRGVNPMNFVSVDDVARFALLGLRDPLARGETIEIGGPENLSLTQIVALVEREIGAPIAIQHIPLPMLRMMSVLAVPVNPSFARLAGMSAYIDTHDMTFDPSPTQMRFPGDLRSMAAVVHERFHTAMAPAAT